MKIGVFGAGGVGGYYGGRLATAGHEVHFVARGEHLAAIRAQGLRVHSVRGDFQITAHATGDPAEIGQCDAVLFCVKSYDSPAAATRLGPMLREGTAVVSLQNGIDNEEILAEAVGWPHVLGGVSLIFSTVSAPGVIAHTGGPSSLSIGEVTGQRSERVLALAAACNEAGIPTDVPDDIRVVLWSKYAFICALAGMTASTRLTIGDIRDSEPAWRMFRSIMEEVVAVARAEGVPLPESLVDDQLRATEALDPGGRSSLYHDLSTGHRMELDALHGALTRLGARHGVPTPASDAVWAILSPWAAKAQR